MTESIFILNRKTFSAVSTIGDLLSPQGDFLCNTLEDVCRNFKVPRVTAIPSGIYPLAFDFSPHYGKEMPHLLNVPRFTAIRIHPGNDKDDTEGCILVGKKIVGLRDWVGDSRPTFNCLLPMLKFAVANGPAFVKITGGYDASVWVEPGDPACVSMGQI